MLMVHKCRVCEVELNDKNWYPSLQKNYNYICIECNKEKYRSHQEANRDKLNEYQRLYRKNNPEKVKAQNTRSSRNRGRVSMSENKECSLYLGVHIAEYDVAERVLSCLFKNVERMPYGNPGYDFLADDEKIDVKSGCIRKTGSTWAFTIKHNTTADYFLCTAFYNTEDLNPLHIWLLPGDKFNHLTTASISQSTLNKWSEYELDIDKVLSCCGTMKDRGIRTIG